MRQPPLHVVGLISLCAFACGCLSQESTKALAQEESRLLGQLQSRTKDNRAAAFESLALLERLGNQYTAQEHTLAMSISKAKLLDALE